MDTDKQAMGLLDQAAVSYVLALTKIDQLSATDRVKVVASSQSTLGDTKSTRRVRVS